MVVNATRVLPVRVHARRPTGGMAEVLLLEPRGDGTWEALARPLRKLTPGTRLVVSAGLEIEVGERLEGGRLVVRPIAAGTLEEALRDVGEMPLPPYIRERSADPERYQTVYARTAGSAAAPTAGLHFTPELLQAVRERCTVVEIDLRIGLDTFRPVVADDLDDHEMHSEAYAIDPGVRATLVAARAAGRRVVAVGTTTARVLETVADPAAPDAGRTRLKIQPGHRFGLVDALVTNFHLPKSTLLALVMAFAGEAETRRLYEEAVARALSLLLVRRRDADHVASSDPSRSFVTGGVPTAPFPEHRLPIARPARLLRGNVLGSDPSEAVFGVRPRTWEAHRYARKARVSRRRTAGPTASSPS